jgi:adenosylhomocysteinase
VTRLEALLDGFAVPEKADALRSADVVITATGAHNIVTAADLPLLADGAVLMNVGHFPLEIDVPGIRAAAEGFEDAADGIETLSVTGDRRVHLLTGGHMVNLAGPRPLGNSIESMDLGFALQARCLEAVARGLVGPEDCVVPVPRRIDEAVATAYVLLSS